MSTGGKKNTMFDDALNIATFGLHKGSGEEWAEDITGGLLDDDARRDLSFNKISGKDAMKERQKAAIAEEKKQREYEAKQLEIEKKNRAAVAEATSARNQRSSAQSRRRKSGGTILTDSLGGSGQSGQKSVLGI